MKLGRVMHLYVKNRGRVVLVVFICCSSLGEILAITGQISRTTCSMPRYDCKEIQTNKFSQNVTYIAMLSFTQPRPSYEEAHITRPGYVQIQGQGGGANTRPNIDLAAFPWQVMTACCLTLDTRCCDLDIVRHACFDVVE